LLSAKCLILVDADDDVVLLRSCQLCNFRWSVINRRSQKKPEPCKWQNP